MKYLGAGTVSFVGFLLATACGQGGSAGGGPPSVDYDDVPDSYEDLPPPTVVVPGDPNRPIPPIFDGVPNNQGDPPPGGGASCRQYCTAVLATGCASDEGEQELSVSECTTICDTQIRPAQCSGQLLDVSLCLIGLLPPGSCEFDDVPEDELLAACYTPLMAYVQCAGVEVEEPEPGEGMVDCTCGCVCEYGCSGTVTNTCTASGAQACALCDNACNTYCASEDCGGSLVPPATAAVCIGR